MTGLLEVSDHVESLVAALERAEPCITRIGSWTADQHGEVVICTEVGPSA